MLSEVNEVCYFIGQCDTRISIYTLEINVIFLLLMWKYRILDFITGIIIFNLPIQLVVKRIIVRS